MNKIDWQTKKNGEQRVGCEMVDVENDVENQLYHDVCSIVDGGRQRVATTVNAEICLMYWQIGKRIKEDVLYNQRAEYGKQIVKKLADKMTLRFGKGWSDRKLLHCIRVAYTFSEEQIVYATRIQLTWTHLRTLMFIDDSLKRDFYLEMARIEHWDTRTLDDKIDSLLYERTALSRKPENVIKQELAKIKATNTLTPDVVFRSSYFLDTIGVADAYSERDLEDAILINL